ncbi:MAG: NAD(P)H-quinone oxidoreductase subunit 5 [Methanobacteriota archaeon]|jgi:NAD(P)H-quinone oxidoreductase subunit 5|uniref:Proton-conducting transporter membrane subunit n=1 Tax=Halorutilus salinus TaxID=2487751 RepID=A0A9Q4GG23_9EURY|nr:proton-conducting transporter membrane subunit [Halorutilus salinus]MCX2818227.1 proton-conducting transporter membrane subunit [Halorutilus salinus]
MTGQNTSPSTVGLPEPPDEPLLPNALTKTVWAVWLASAVAAFLVLRSGEATLLDGLLRIDGLTVVMWLVVTFFSGIVHSYSRRYMSGDRRVRRFYTDVFVFTVSVMVLVAADHLALFWLSWLAMGVVMADLIGHVRGWRQSEAARRIALRYFGGGSALLGVGIVSLWWTTGSATVSGVGEAVDALPSEAVVVGGGAIVLAAMIQSALLPFHGWLLSSMTAPTPASALMHAGFVNGGGILLTRFSPLFVESTVAMTAILVVGATSAILGKLLKSVQPDIKRKLGCSTVGQMGFMIAQAGLGFFGAAITHLILHGFYKAYLFLSSGGRVTNRAPGEEDGTVTTAGIAVTVPTALAGGVVFAVLTGKGTALDSGLILAILVVITVMHASLGLTSRKDVPRLVRFAGIPVVFLPAIVVYGSVYNAVSWAMSGLPASTVPQELTPVHIVVVAAFVVGYVAVEYDVQTRSERLYTKLLNLSQPSPKTVLTNKGEYDDG